MGADDELELEDNDDLALEENEDDELMIEENAEEPSGEAVALLSPPRNVREEA
jgi:hypothetical protein